ncbi:MAG: hypothetical protein ACQESO_05555 [Bacillota bacterium]
MNLFSEPIGYLREYLAHAAQRKAVQSLNYSPFLTWPEGSSLVLQENTAIELGGSEKSLLMILWTGQAGIVSPGCISLAGHDLTETDQSRLPFTQVIMVRGDFGDEYETYQVLQDTLFDTRLQGISTRFWPDRQKVWNRVSSEALAGGFNLMRYGGTLLKKLQTLPTVKEAEVIFSTESPLDQGLLAPAARKTQEIMETLLKIYEELNFDCESCEYKEVCAEVADLKEIHRRLHGERD